MIGLCGALAGMEGGDRARRKALGITTPAVIMWAGPIASVQGLALSLGSSAVALVGLLVLQTHGWLYLTF